MEDFIASITCPKCGHVGATDADGNCVECGFYSIPEGVVEIPEDPALAGFRPFEKKDGHWTFEG